MKIEQFVMAYGVDHDRLRAVLPEGFESLRPVLRINAEIRDGKTGYLEFNTAVDKNGNKGWLNIGFRDNVPFERNGKTVIFTTDCLKISFTAVGIEGSCPAEKDNCGCYFQEKLRQPEAIFVNKEFCDCEFRWLFGEDFAHGKSTGKTLPAIPSEIKNTYPKKEFNTKNASAIPCDSVLGAYKIIFER